MGYSECPPAPSPDRTATVLSSLMIAGIIVSYLPQHIRIIRNKTSEGFSRAFLFLGATSSASSLCNVVTLQRQELLCCPAWGAGPCLESILGVLQLFFQWACFNVIVILWIAYLPNERRYHEVEYIVDHQPFGPDPNRIAVRRGESDGRRAERPWVVTMRERSDEGWFALVTAYAILLHFILFAVLTIMIVDPAATLVPHEHVRRSWALFLGILSSVLAGFQYIPQIVLTWRTKLVGSLSIPMMLIQSPGSFVFVYSLAIRPHVNWTTWIVFAITGTLQACLLALCFAWKRRQSRLGIDDYGQPLEAASSDASSDSSISLPNERSSLIRR